MPTTASDAALSAAELPGPDRHLPFYGLASPPFRSGADPARLWLGNPHRALLDTLARAIREGNGIALLTGDAGTGKTSLAQRFIAMLGPSGISVGRVSSPGQAPSDFFEAVLSAYGVRIDRDIRSSSPPPPAHQASNPPPFSDKPPLPDATLEKWGEAFRAGNPNATEAIARSAITSTFPANYVSRDRLRRILPPRQRGRPLKNKD